jgi:hypothetical protein
MRPVGAAVAGLAASIAVAGCGVPADPSPRPAPGFTTAERGGVVVTLAIDRDVVLPGESVRVQVTARNLGPHPVVWHGFGCELAAVFTIRADGNAEPEPGRRWPGMAGRLKDTVAASADGLAPFVPAEQPAVGVPTACNLDRGFNELAPRGELAAQATWRAETGFGAPAPRGGYRLGAAFPLIARGRPQDPAAFDAGQDVRPIELELPLTIAGNDQDVLSPGLAIDALLADPVFASWLVTHPPDGWAGERLHFRDGAWEFELNLRTSQVARARIGARTGAIVELTIGRP